MSDLVVWMYGLPVGRLSRQGGSLAFAYTPEALQLGAGRPLLSVSMPTVRRPYRGDIPHAFFDGLLPEGEARRMIAYDFGVDDRDTFALLLALGRDCAGALTLLPDGEVPTAAGAPEPMTEADVADRIRMLRFHPLGVDDRVRVSLAGMQEKLLLSRLGDGWALPVDGAPSTHILKPAHQLLADSIENEALCMRVARHLGITVAHVVIEQFGDRLALVIERYDRAPVDDGSNRVVRIHQEDFCQAHGLGTGVKYEERGGPSARGCAELLRRWSRMEELERLLDLVALNVLVGNADAHAKNLSLLHGADGDIRLAPAYDVMSTVHYSQADSVAGMFVNGVRSIKEITAGDLVEEATSWGLRRNAAAARVDRLVESADQAIARSAEELASPEELIGTLRARAAALKR